METPRTRTNTIVAFLKHCLSAPRFRICLLLFHTRVKKQEVEFPKKVLWWTSMELDVSFDLDL